MEMWLVSDYHLSKNGVKFRTDDTELQKVFDTCEELCKLNVREFGDYTCLMEGAKYIGAFTFNSLRFTCTLQSHRIQGT